MKVTRSSGLLAVALAAVITIPTAYAAGLFGNLPVVGGAAYCALYAGDGTTCQGNVPAGPSGVTGTERIAADTGLANGASPQTVLIPTGLLMPELGSPRNFLDNGAMAIAQRGTGTQTCAANAGIVSANYVSDRWACQANVGSGAGQAAVITASPAPPTGFTNSVKVWRNSGALLQPVCLMQEIPTVESTQLAGKVVTLSFYAAGLAGLVADNGGVINATLITGTGSDQGLGSVTASPAITPAWTGVASANTQAFTVTTTFARQNVTWTVPATATELAVAICFTPTATGAGATDGFAVTGIQLEQATAPSLFEVRPVQIELAKAQRYYVSIAEAAAGVVQSPVGTAQGTTTTCTTQIPFPVTMRTAPTYAPVPTPLTASTFKIVSASQAATALGTPFAATLVANTPTAASINFTTTGMTAKDSCFLVGAGGGAALTWSADF